MVYLLILVVQIFAYLHFLAQNATHYLICALQKAIGAKLIGYGYMVFNGQFLHEFPDNITCKLWAVCPKPF
jgi:hypothetical protein